MKESLNRLIQKKNSLEEQYDEALLKYENSSALPLYQQDELYEIFSNIRDELEDIEEQIKFKQRENEYDVGSFGLQ